MAELKKTVYEPKVSLSGSRDQLCVNNDLKYVKNLQLNCSCKKRISLKQCNYYINYADRKEYLLEDFAEGKPRFIKGLAHPNNPQLLDLEDLRAYSEQNKFCPYYYQRETKNFSDVVFMPYNYLFSFNRLG